MPSAEIRRVVERTAARIRRVKPGKVVLVKANGVELEPWEVRAGMVVTKTVYNHENREDVVTLEYRYDA